MDETAQCCFQIDLDLGSSEWKIYRDIETDVIEEAFEQSESSVLLDRYRINHDHETKRRRGWRKTVSRQQTH